MDRFAGKYYIYDSIFKNNRGIKGSIIQVIFSHQSDYKANFYNSVFINNSSKKYGGVIYSIDSNAPYDIYFENCEYFNNTAEFGDISYSLDKNSEPMFNNFKNNTMLLNLKKNKNAFVTNPTHLAFNKNSFNDRKILSGMVIKDSIIANLYDDYDNQFSFGNDIDSLNLNELMFFQIEIKDKNGGVDNAILLGQTQGYCWEDECSIENLKILGYPGIYYLTLKLLTFGTYSEFINNTISMEIEIVECDETKYNYQIKDHSSIKSCYIPTCEPSCNSGKCINDNICNCSNTTYTGKY
eukprot:jgi/Orpsp1_1/1189876/evm.model.d7180000075160.1